jgi:hypothetical protein
MQQDISREVMRADSQLRPTYLQSGKSFTENDSGESDSPILVSSALGQSRLTEESKGEFVWLNDNFVAVYGEKYLQESAESARVNLLWQLFIRKGYSFEDMTNTVLEFFASKQSVYSTWKPADILEQFPAHELLTFVQYCQLTVGERKHFVAYQTDKGVLFGDARFIGDRLPRVEYKPERKALPEKRDGVTPETQEEIGWCMRALRAEDQIKFLRNERDDANDRAFKLFNESEALTKRVEDLTLEIERLHSILRSCGHGDKVPRLPESDPPF